MFELHEVPNSVFVVVCDTVRSGSEEVFLFFDFSHCPCHGGLCEALHVSSSSGVRVLSISEVWADSHRASLVHISSIFLSDHNCSRVSSPSTEGGTPILLELSGLYRFAEFSTSRGGLS